MKCEEMIWQKMAEEETLKDMQQQRVEQRRSKNLDVIKASRGDAGGASSSAEQARLALAEKPRRGSYQQEEEGREEEEEGQEEEEQEEAGA
jgi:hypothetical protein